MSLDKLSYRPADRATERHRKAEYHMTAEGGTIPRTRALGYLVM